MAHSWHARRTFARRHHRYGKKDGIPRESVRGSSQRRGRSVCDRVADTRIPSSGNAKAIIESARDGGTFSNFQRIPGNPDRRQSNRRRSRPHEYRTPGTAPSDRGTTPASGRTVRAAAGAEPAGADLVRGAPTIIASARDRAKSPDPRCDATIRTTRARRTERARVAGTANREPADHPGNEPAEKSSTSSRTGPRWRTLEFPR